jgi:hypothetical protein
MLADQRWNPFDIKNRSAHWVDSLRNAHIYQIDSPKIVLSTIEEDPHITSVPDTPAVVEASVLVSENEPENPFEVVRVPKSDINFEDPLMENVTKRVDKDFLFTILMILMICLAVLVGLYRTFIVKLYKSIWNDNYLKLLYRSVNEPIRFRFGAFYLLYFLNAGLFIYLSLGLLGKNEWQEGPVLLLACVVIVFLVYGVKHLVLYFLGALFPVSKESFQFNFTILLYNCLLGILLVPVNAIMAFAVEEIVIIAAYAGLALSLLFYALRQLKGLILGMNFLSKNFFHFFIYLCAVEIGPIFILWKLFQSV